MEFLIFVAVLPALLLLINIYNMDRVDKEPIDLLVKLFFLGGLTIVSAILIGNIAEIPVKAMISEQSLLYKIIDNFILIALVEEGGKFVVLRWKTWNSGEFNYTFDAVVYAVTVSLGFAAFENILYLLDFSIATAVLRGLLAVPGHAIDAVFMGCFYGRAKRCAVLGDEAGKDSNLRKALLVPVLLHGFYDFCLSTGYDFFILIFLVFEVIITITAILETRRLSREDTPVG